MNASGRGRPGRPRAHHPPAPAPTVATGLGGHAPNTPKSAVELAALRLRDGVRVARACLAEHGRVNPDLWPDLDGRLCDLVCDARDSLVRGDLLLVDVSAYRPDLGQAWCVYSYSSPGSASVYPYKIDVPGRGSGQYRASEILGWARPLELHRTILTVRRETPAGDASS